MKADKATIKKRVEDVLQLRLLGAELLDIRQHAAAQTPPWGKSDRQLFRYIRRADDLLARMLETNRERLFARHIGQRRALFARAMSTSDYRTAAAVLKDEAAMFDVYGHKSKPGPTNGPAPTAADVVAILSRQLATIDASDLPDAEKARLTATISDAFMRAHSTVNLERQLSELTTRLEAVAKKGKG